MPGTAPSGEGLKASTLPRSGHPRSRGKLDAIERPNHLHWEARRDDSGQGILYPILFPTAPGAM